MSDSAFVAAIRPKSIRVIDDRREEVDGVDEREVVTQAVDAGVIGEIEPDQHVRIGRAARDASEQRPDRRRGQLAAAPGAVREGGQRNDHHYDRSTRVPDRDYTDADIDAAIAAITDPGRLQDAQDLVMRVAPSLQNVLGRRA